MYKKYLKYRINPNDVDIDTNVLYESLNYKYEEYTQSAQPAEGLYPNNSVFLKFYEDGTFYSYNVENKKMSQLLKEDLKPANGHFNFVTRKGDKINIMDYSTINCGAFSKNDFRLKGDTLMISAGSDKGSRIWYYYVKYNVPKELLTQNSDIN